MAQRNPLRELVTPSPRLEGDDLYAWATLIAAVRHAEKDLRDYGRLMLEKHSLDPTQHVIRDDGYIKTVAEMQAQMREQLAQGS